MSWITSFVNHRTRDVEVSFLILDECSLFRAGGLETLDQNNRKVWVPWIAVYWHIPRMRVLKLVDGTELRTDYPKGPTCEEPPKFLFEMTDSIHIEGRPPTARITQPDPSIAELFVLARSEEARAEGVARFIEEVEAGNHPRLPRTEPRMLREGTVALPKQSANATAEAEIEVRVGERGRVLRVSTVKSSGDSALDAAFVKAASSNGYFCGGEMGVPVPATMRLHYKVEDGKTTLEVNPAVPSIWER